MNRVPNPSTRGIHLLAILTLLLFGAGPAHGAVITNGGFEIGPDPGSFANLSAGSMVITGWTVTGVAIDYIGTGWQSSDGVRSFDLDGSVGSPFPNGGIKQTFGTTPGTTYLVTFDMAGNPGGGPTIKPMRVEAAGQSADFFFDITGHTLSDMGWVTKTWEFTATTAATTLEFRSLTLAPETGFGPALDNVRVAAVPEPSTLALFAVSTVSLLGYGWIRRKRVAV